MKRKLTEEEKMLKIYMQTEKEFLALVVNIWLHYQKFKQYRNFMMILQ